MNARSAVDLAEEIKSGERSPVSLVDETLARIEAHNGRTNAYITVIEESAREAARQDRKSVV